MQSPSAVRCLVPRAVRLLALASLLVLLPGLAHAWWNDAWTFRKKITLNASPAGADLKQGVADVPVLVRLHTGNFVFADSNPDGGDIRFVASDEKTPLRYHIEQWDPTNELALIWVKVPRITAGAATDHIWLYSGNKDAKREENAKETYDASSLLVLHFAAQGAPADASPYAHSVAESSAAAQPQGPIGVAAAFNGSSRIRVAAAPTLKSGAQGSVTFSAWIRIAGAQSQAALVSLGGFSFGIDGLKLVAQDGGARVTAANDLTTGTWHHVAAVAGAGKLTLFLDGAAVGEGTAASADLAGDLVIGERFTGDLDEAQLSNVARTADWIHASWAAQGGEGKLVAFGEDEQSGGGHSYFRILLGAVTLDGWVVIGILGVMFVISMAVMIGKGLFVTRTDRANQIFIEQFQKNQALMLDPAMAEKNPASMQASSLYRIYRIGLRELKQRFDHFEQSGQTKQLSPQALGAIKASMDAGMVRETTRLNNQMVLLTIAISGGPFLGLLGTVVGVMITFAAIAAAGDVNVNSIAPGIAAALVATVAGLGVAIPALFGYNYLASKIKTISNDMAVFADELVTKMAERYAP
jgi:biopolymer transport protein ExbB